MKIVKKKIKDLKPAPYNPRKISKEELKKLENSIKTFGYVDLLIYNKKTSHIVGGNQRYKILKKLYGEDFEIDVVEIDLPLDREKALNIALNKISGEFEEYSLRSILEELKNNKDLLSLTGFDDKEIENILSDINETHNITDLDTINKDELVQTMTLKFVPENFEIVNKYFQEKMREFKVNSREEVLILLAKEKIFTVKK